MSRPTRKPPTPLAALVLAAGQGTRMRSARAKVLHPLLGRPMAAYPVAAARALGARPVVVVVGHQRTEVEAELGSRFGAELTFVDQREMRGTGHAVRMALPALGGFAGTVLILYGDVPLLRDETVAALVNTVRRHGCLAMVTASHPDATGYGRVLRDERGHVLGVVEHKDASEEERRIREINAGIYAAPAPFLREAVSRLRAKNAQGEYYLTDIVARAARSIGVATIAAEHGDVAGVNDRAQLAEAEAVLRLRQARRVMLGGVTLRDPERTIIEVEATVEADAELGAGVVLRGRTRVGPGARIDEGCVLRDTEVGANAHLKPYTVATEAVIGPGAEVGPFAHLRPGSVLGEDVHVGNFVETKKTRLGRGSKANHLSYLGDTIIGDKVNVGAGTITCNYNGYEKQTTIIDDGAFIGSDTQLVAPVRVGARAVVAAGTTVTEDVPAGALAISRVAQQVRPGYADKLAERYRKGPGGKA